MKKYVLVFVGIIFLISTIFSGCLGNITTDYFSGEYEADEGTVLNVLTINGQIEIYAYDGDTVSLNGVKKSTFGQDELDNVEINVVESKDEIRIEAVYTGVRKTVPSVDMNIKVPEGVLVEDVTTSNGAVQIYDVSGNVSASSSNGNVIVENVDGYVEASSSNGDVEVKNCKSIGDLSTSNGRIFAEIFDFEEDIDIKTSNGRITVYINPSLNADIEMETSNGDIDISGLTLNLSQTSDKYMKGKLGIGGNEIDIETSNGNIFLYKLET